MPRGLLRGRMLCMLLLLSFVPHVTANGQQAEMALPAQILDVVVKTAGPLTAERSASVQALRTPLVVPNWLVRAQGFIDEFRQFERVPSRSGDFPASETPTLVELLRRMANTVELSSRSLSSAERAELEAARQILFSPIRSETPSSLHARYLSYKQQYDAIAQSLPNEQNPAQLANLRNRLISIERDWSLFGGRAEVDAALETLSRLNDRPQTQLFQAWQQTLTTSPAGSPERLADLIAAGSWVRVAATNAVSLGSLVLERSSGTGTSRRLTLPQPESVSLEFVIFEFTRNWLDHPFLENRTWRSRERLVISDGNAEMESPGELIPRYVSHLILVRNLEITFRANVSEEVGEAMRGNNTLRLNGLPLRTSDVNVVAFQPRQLFIASPIILGMITGQMARSPDPLSDRVWPSANR